MAKLGGAGKQLLAFLGSILNLPGKVDFIIHLVIACAIIFGGTGVETLGAGLIVGLALKRAAGFGGGA